MPLTVEQKRAFISAEREGRLPTKVDKVKWLRQAEADPGFIGKTVETSPLPFEPSPSQRQVTAPGGPGMFSPGSVEMVKQAAIAQTQAPQLTEAGLMEQDLRGRGIETREGGLDAKTRTVLSTVVDAPSKIKYLQSQNIDARMDPQSGQAVYLNPETNRYHLVDELGASVADLADAVGGTIPFVASTGGTAIGALGGIPGMALGGVAGEYAGKHAQAKLGEWLGAPSDPEAVESEARTGAAVAGVSPFVGAGLSRLGGRMLNPGARANLTAEEAELYLDAARKNLDVADEVEQITGKVFRPTLGEATDMEKPLLQQAAARSRLPDVDQAELERQGTNVEAVKAYADALTPPKVEGGPTVEGAIRRIQKEREGKMAGRVTTVEEVGRNVVDGIQKLDKVATGKAIREDLKRIDREQRDVEKAAWEGWRNKIGYNEKKAESQVKIVSKPGDELHTAWLSMSAELKKALSESQKKTTKVGLPEKLGAMYKSPPGVIILPPGVKPIPKEKDAALDAMQVKEYLSFLKAEKRARQADPTKNTKAIGSIDRMIKALTELRKRATDPETLDMWEAAENLTKVNRDLFQKSALNGIMRQKGGEFVVDEDKIFKEIVKPDAPSNSQAYADALTTSPTAMNEVREGIHQFYRSNFTKNGLPDSARHQKFIEKYGKSIKPFFGEEDFKQIETLGGFAKVIDKRRGQYQVFQEAMKKNTALSRTGAFRSDNFSKQLLTEKFNLKDVQEIKRALQKQYPKTLESLKHDLGNQIRSKVIKRDGVDLTALEKLQKEKTPHIATLMGPKYVEGLEILRKAGEMMSRRVGTPPGAKDLTGPQMGRVLLFPQLSHKGSILKKLGVEPFRNARERALYNLLSNPDNMKQFVELHKTQASADKVSAFLTTLGASIMGEVEEE